MWETVIGLEVHVELATCSKLFCGCRNRFGAPPNSLVCPVCLGLPGVLPVLNRQAVELLLRSALAAGCSIPPLSKFDRKNYFYPDMPKNYQISQYDLPLAVEGCLPISDQGEGRCIGIHRIHLEEDTGKSIHQGTIDQSTGTLVDYNRAGVPLMEIVSEPEISSPAEAYDYLVALRDLLRWLEVSDCKMEEGSLRCDANISLRPKGETELGVKTEVKNMNSFRAVEKALACEVERQRQLLADGRRVIQETRGWDEARQVTIPMRSKEFAHDYRYFPEPDLVPLQIDPAWVERLRQGLPELPWARRERFRSRYGLSNQAAARMVSTSEMSRFFEAVVERGGEPVAAANWLMGDVSAYLNEKGLNLTQSKLTTDSLAQMLALLSEGAISGKIAKLLVLELLESGGSAAGVVSEKGWGQVSDPDELSAIVARVISQNPEIVLDVRSGKERAFKFLVGQVMKATAGRANPEVVNRLLKESI